MINDIIKDEKNLSEKKGESWTEYHIYEIKIKNLEKERDEKEKEAYELSEQKKEKNNDYNKKMKMIDDEIYNLGFYKTNIQKDETKFLPVTLEDKIGKEIYDGDHYTNVCQTCKYNCHIKCDEMIMKFCKCFKFAIIGFKCQVCPNKCYSDSHEVVRYQYPKDEYKKIDDILKPYFKGEYPKKISLRNKIDKVIALKEEEKRNLSENFEKNKNNLDILIEENKNIIKSRLEARNLVIDKRNEIYEEHRRKLEENIEKLDNELKQFINNNLKAYEKLFVEIFNREPQFSQPEKCC